MRERTVWKWAFLDWEGGRGALGKKVGESVYFWRLDMGDGRGEGGLSEVVQCPACML